MWDVFTWHSFLLSCYCMAVCALFILVPSTTPVIHACLPVLVDEAVYGPDWISLFQSAGSFLSALWQSIRTYADHNRKAVPFGNEMGAG